MRTLSAAVWRIDLYTRTTELTAKNNPPHTHKKSDAAQIASEQQPQNAVLRPAQRFAPTAAHPDSNHITVSNTASLNTISRTHAEKNTGCKHAQHRGSTRRATQHR